MKGFGRKFEDKKKGIQKNINSINKQIIQKAFNIHSQGNIIEAAKLYQYLIKQGLNNQNIFSNYGGILKDLGNLKDAELYTRKAIEINPDFPDSYLNLGGILRNLGKFKDAESCSKKIMSLRPWSIAGSYSFNYWS
mgnify:CR=1 FL=1